MNKAVFQGIRENIIREINQSKSKIDIAVAWFTDTYIYNILLEKLKQGIKIRLIIRNDYINNNTKGLDFEKLINSQKNHFQLYFSDESELLHHKFCIIDNAILFNGSYNWTYLARKNKENIIISDDKNLIQQFDSEFKNIIQSKNPITKIRKFTKQDLNLFKDKDFQESFVNSDVKEDVFLNDETQNQNSDEFSLIEDSIILYHQQNYESSKKLLLKNLVKYSNSGETYYWLAWNEFRQNNFKEAEEYALKAKELNFDGFRVHNILGCIYENLGKTKECFEFFDKSIGFGENKQDDYTFIAYQNKLEASYKFREESFSKRIADKLMLIVTNLLRKYKDKNSTKNQILKLKAYLARGFASSNETNIVRDGEKAKILYDSLPIEEQDLHVLDDIKFLLKQ